MEGRSMRLSAGGLDLAAMFFNDRSAQGEVDTSTISFRALERLEYGPGIPCGDTGSVVANLELDRVLLLR